MPSAVFATFRTEEDAERALSTIESNIPLVDSAVVADGASGALTLESLDLSPEERSACADQMKRGGFLMIAQAGDDGTADGVLNILQSAPADGGPLIIAEASSPQRSAPEPTQEQVRTPVVEQERTAVVEEEPTPVVEEERIPIVEEELRVGKREVVRGGTAVHSYIAEVPVEERVTLLEEVIDIQRRPVNRRLTEEEVDQAGLLAERVIEVTAMREEAVVSKEAFIREELVVTKKVEQRVEEIHETLRRTEVRTEELHPETEQ